MKVGILTIGDELLSGSTLDTNSQVLAQILFHHGIKPILFMTCSDNDIVPVIREMKEKCDLLLTSGGLGPTHDDLTTKSIAEAAGVDMVRSEEAMQDITKRFPHLAAESPSVADLPEGARPLLNKVGFAPGFALKSGRTTIIAFPGVPYELEEMAATFIPRILKELLFEEKGVFSHSIHFCHTVESHIAPTVSKLSLTFPELEFGIYPKIGTVTVSFSGKAKDRESFIRGTEDVIDKLYEEFPTLVFPSKRGDVIESVFSELQMRKETIALAESCTGGEMASSLTKIPGVSDVFLLSIVAYSNEAKQKLLGVSSQTLEQHGAVSEDVVVEMAKGLFACSSATYAIAVSGIAGPEGGTIEKPVGTVWGAIAKRNGEIRTGLIPLRKGLTRELIIKRASSYLFGALWRQLAYDICPFT